MPSDKKSALDIKLVYVLDPGGTLPIKIEGYSEPVNSTITEIPKLLTSTFY